MQMSLAINAPRSIRGIRKEESLALICWNEKEKRSRPYPPSLRRTPASTIDPDTGASTWALGSQRWTP